MSTLRSDSSIQFLKGVGPRRAEWFAQLGLHTVHDLLHYFPFRHEVDHGEVLIEDLEPDTNVTIRGEVVRLGGRWPTLRAEVTDGTGACILRWFNERYGGQRLARGAIVVATGKVRIYDDQPELIQPRIQVFDPDAVTLTQPQGPRKLGVYRGNDTLKSPVIRRAVLTILQQARLPVDDPLPPRLLAKHHFPPREHAIRQMHCPASEAELERARARLAYEEFFLMETAMALRRRKRLALQSGQKLHTTPEIDARIRARFPFPLTAAQDQAIREIAQDLQSGRPMTRLLQGDVGSGKTVVALYACLVAVANGRQAAIMAPTEILAQQHYRNIDRYLRDSRVRYVLLRGKTGRKERADVLAAVERGDLDLVVGTQALIQKDVAFHKLALVVVDEQHKFGVLQRHEFRTKGPLPHYLVMTATPIPRTLSMTVFGDLDVSVLRESPPGRGKIITKVVTAAKWDTVMNYVRGRLERGEQAYVVCPQIGEGSIGVPPVRADEQATRQPGNEATRSRRGEPAAVSTFPRSHDPTPPRSPADEITTVTDIHQRLTSGPWRGLNVGLLHGELRPADKQQAINDFVAGRLHAVVATTVVEVGVDVANATIMIVEHADRYGLSQLHQLRGRVGRGSKDSLCVLISRERGRKAAERLAVMARTTDGFAIAEADLRQRGPGELFGTRQHGLPELHVASILDDFGLLEKARQDAFDLVAADPTLAKPEHQALLPGLKRMFGEKLSLIDAG
jgi:ATP-dependent DNA helicase RecG